VEIQKPPRPRGATGVKLGEVEGIKARLDKRLGSDELLKVICLLDGLNGRLFIVFFTSDPELHMKLRRILESLGGFTLLTRYISISL
jgi:hypothetical protein